MTTPLQQIKEARELAKADIEIAEHIEKLQKNRSFQKVINEFVCKDLAARTAAIYNRPEITESTQKSLENTLTMIATLQSTLSQALHQGDAAVQRLEEIDEAEAEYLAEQGE